MEKHNRFMAELRLLLTRYHAVLGDEKGNIHKVYVTYMDDIIGTEGAYDGHPIYEGDGEFTGEEPSFPEIPVGDVGTSYMHCGLCLEEWKATYKGVMSPKEYARQQGAWTKQGLQLWCNRHEVNIAHIDFVGQKVRASTLVAKEGEE